MSLLEGITGQQASFPSEIPPTRSPNRSSSSFFVPSLDDTPQRNISRSVMVDCGWSGGGTNVQPQDHLIVNASGREIRVSLGVTLLLTHVQRALERELGTEGFEIYDVHGIALRTDQDLREAVMAGRTPLAAQLIETMQQQTVDQREELAQVICQLICEHTNESEGKIKKLYQQVDHLKEELQQQRKENDVQVKDLRNEMNSAIGELKDIVNPLVSSSTGSTGSAGKVAAADDVGGDAATHSSLGRMMEIESQLQSELQRLENRLDEMTGGLTGILTEHEEYITRTCAKVAEEVQAIAKRCSEFDEQLAKADIGTPKQQEVNPHGSPGGSAQALPQYRVPPNTSVSAVCDTVLQRSTSSDQPRSEPSRIHGGLGLDRRPMSQSARRPISLARSAEISLDAAQDDHAASRSIPQGTLRSPHIRDKEIRRPASDGNGTPATSQRSDRLTSSLPGGSSGTSLARGERSPVALQRSTADFPMHTVPTSVPGRTSVTPLGRSPIASGCHPGGASSNASLDTEGA